MNENSLMSTTPGRAALGTLVVSAAVMLWTLVHAVRIDPVPPLQGAQGANALSIASPPAPSATDVGRAVESDLFAADRTAPARRYRVPGEDVEDGTPAAPPVLPVVLGTAAADSTRSFATVQLGDAQATIVRNGNKIGEYTVKSITRGSVVFMTKTGKRLEIPALKP